MIRLLLAASIAISDYLRRYMPTNKIRDRVYTRDGLKWGIPAMLLAIPYFGIALWLAKIIETGAPGWLNIAVLICLWSGFKMLWLGPISLVKLVRARIGEAIERRRTRPALAYGYTATENGQALDYQQAQAHQIAQAHGYHIEAHGNDWMGDRTELHMLLDRIEQGGIDALIVSDITRLGRKISDVQAILNTLDHAGVQLLTADQELSDDDKETIANFKAHNDPIRAGATIPSGPDGSYTYYDR